MSTTTTAKLWASTLIRSAEARSPKSCARPQLGVDADFAGKLSDSFAHSSEANYRRSPHRLELGSGTTISVTLPLQTDESGCPKFRPSWLVRHRHCRQSNNCDCRTPSLHLARPQLLLMFVREGRSELVTQGCSLPNNIFTRQHAIHSPYSLLWQRQRDRLPCGHRDM